MRPENKEELYVFLKMGDTYSIAVLSLVLSSLTNLSVFLKGDPGPLGYEGISGYTGVKVDII